MSCLAFFGAVPTSRSYELRKRLILGSYHEAVSDHIQYRVFRVSVGLRAGIIRLTGLIIILEKVLCRGGHHAQVCAVSVVQAALVVRVDV